MKRLMLLVAVSLICSTASAQMPGDPLASKVAALSNLESAIAANLTPGQQAGMFYTRMTRAIVSKAQSDAAAGVAYDPFFVTIDGYFNQHIKATRDPIYNTLQFAQFEYQKAIGNNPPPPSIYVIQQIIP